MNQHEPWTPDEDRILLDATTERSAYYRLKNAGYVRTMAAVHGRREKLKAKKKAAAKRPWSAGAAD